MFAFGVVLVVRGSLAPAHAPRSEVARTNAEKAWLRIAGSVAHFARVVDALLAVVEAMHMHADHGLLAELCMEEATNRAPCSVFDRTVIHSQTW